MNRLTCECCGGRLKESGLGKYECEYCGTHYEDREGGVFRIEVQNSPVINLKADCILNDELFRMCDEKQIAGAVYTNMGRQLAEQILPFCEFTTYHDPTRQQVKVAVSVKIIEAANKGLNVRRF